MNTVLFVNATIGFSENLFLVIIIIIIIIIIIFSETNKPYVIFLQYVWIFCPDLGNDVGGNAILC